MLNFLSSLLCVFCFLKPILLVIRWLTNAIMDFYFLCNITSAKGIYK